MIFTHDTQHSLLAIVDLVNTDPIDDGEEGLATVEDLADYVRRHRVSGVSRVTEQDLGQVRSLRSRFRAVFEAGSLDRMAALVNSLAGEAPVTPRLTDHDDYDWHMHYFAPGAALAEHLAVDGALALAQTIVAGEADRLRICEAPDCQQVLLDLSRNRSKRYCDPRTCGNRLHVAAYRERQRAIS